MSTFADDIEDAAGGDSIEAVVIGDMGDMGWGTYGVTDRHLPTMERKGEVLSWDEARPLLDYDYERGFGAPDCHAVYAWTANRVLWVTQYDGATGIDSAPRHPTAVTPEMPGG